MSTNIRIQKYAERHFLKSFKKKYKGARDKTYISLCLVMERIHKYLQTTLAEKVFSDGNSSIIKLEFTIAGSQISPHASGNRVIVHWDEVSDAFDILLIYMKTDIPKKMGETAWRKHIIKQQYQKMFPCCGCL